MSESFLSRWSRRKREASIPPPASEASGGEGGERSEPGGGISPVTQASVSKTEAPPTPDPSPPRAARVGGGEPHDPAPQKVEFDPATLPPLESIEAGTDVSAFLRPGVPADLAQAALRRAWVADPAIHDFVGLAENAWDFNAPGGVPGFGPLQAIDDVQRLAAQVAGVVSAVTPETEPAAKAGEPESAPQEIAKNSLPEIAVSGSDDDAAAAHKDVSGQESKSSRPRHGSALPE
jgi:uncharacterized protein DUF3306